MARILVIDDDRMIGDTLTRVFGDLGHGVDVAYSLEEGLKKAGQGAFDVVFLDVRLPDGSGLDVLSSLQGMPSSPEVVVITGYADRNGAEVALSENAWDYLKKPASMDTVVSAVEQVLKYREQKSGHGKGLEFDRGGIIGDSPGMRKCLSLAARATSSMANVILTGETGTGKELFARAIHDNSSRASGPFVVVDCASLPKSLMESVLFGHAKGAFTGAHAASEGLIKQADGGTLFLDEIGELPLSMQKAFLRVLEEKRFRHIGSAQEVESDFRLISATNRDLDQMVKKGRFRKDLLFRLRAIHIHLPPLRERAEDIRDLSAHYMNRLSRKNGTEPKSFSPKLMEALVSYHWPGNVRELHHTLDWVYAQAMDEPTLFAKHLPPAVRMAAVAQDLEQDAEMPGPGVKEQAPPPDTAMFPETDVKWHDYRKKLLDEGEKRYLQDLMARSGGSVKEAASVSGLSQPRLYELLRKHNIPTK
ncbi:MAG: sigma-54-dependent Fis family transcriptional regulator [Deltaproteobacteria bacterium]|nr:sigma-54-dependent Fis family transcriptional regulator [Deltaproteobacteria bacterium]